MQLELEEAARSLIAERIVSPAPLASVEARANAIRARAHRLRHAGIGAASLIAIVVVAAIVHSASPSPHSVVIQGSGSANVVPVHCCHGDEGFALNGIVPSVRPRCADDEPNVTLAFTESRLSFTFSCTDVLHNPQRVETQAIAKVATRRDADKRAANIVDYETQLGVYGDLVNGHRSYPDDLRSDTFSLAVAGTDYWCTHAEDLQFRANEIRDAAREGESAVHWLKIEAARVAGACPGKLATLYNTVQRAGHADAVATVQPLLADAMNQLARLRAIVSNEVKLDHGTLLKAEAVLSTPTRAAAYLTGDVIPGDQPAWAVQLVGNFEVNSPGGRFNTPTQVHVLDVILDARTLRTVEGGYDPAPHDLSHLGTVITLAP